MDSVSRNRCSEATTRLLSSARIVHASLLAALVCYVALLGYYLLTALGIAAVPLPGSPPLVATAAVLFAIAAYSLMER